MPMEPMPKPSETARAELDRLLEALAVEGAHLFEPGGTGRVMRQWVVLPWEQRSIWERFAALALRDLKASL